MYLNLLIFIFYYALIQLGMASALETLCGQAFGAKKYHMLGVYMQRSWIVLFMCCVLILPLFLFASPILKFMGQPPEVADLTGAVALWIIPLHFCFAFVFPLQRFLQSQTKTAVLAWVSLVALLVHVIISWYFVYGLKLGVVGTAVTLSFSWWVLVAGLFGYIICGGCPSTWTGFSIEAFFGLWEFIELSVASGVMLWYSLSLSMEVYIQVQPLLFCLGLSKSIFALNFFLFTFCSFIISLENWYYRILILITGNVKNAAIALDAVSIWYAVIIFFH